MILFDAPFFEQIFKSLKLCNVHAIAKQQAIILLHRKLALYSLMHMLMDHLLSMIPVMQEPEIVNISLNDLQEIILPLQCRLAGASNLEQSYDNPIQHSKHYEHV